MQTINDWKEATALAEELAGTTRRLEELTQQGSDDIDQVKAIALIAYLQLGSFFQ